MALPKLALLLDEFALAALLYAFWLGEVAQQQRCLSH
jgi:hypothetical protein